MESPEIVEILMEDESDEESEELNEVIESSQNASSSVSSPPPPPSSDEEEIEIEFRQERQILPVSTGNTLYFCAKCDVGLCIVECFERWHTRVNV